MATCFGHRTTGGSVLLEKSSWYAAQKETREAGTEHPIDNLGDMKRSMGFLLAFHRCLERGCHL